MGNASQVAIGNINPAGRYVADVVTVVRTEVDSDTNIMTIVLTTVGRSAGSDDANDIITIDLNAPASDLVNALGRSKSAVLRTLFGGLV